MTESRRIGVEIAGAFALAAVLTLVTFRDGPRLTFDGYYYCEFAKRYAHEWPDRFGFHWPLGYPLLGALLGRAGIPAYWALVSISATALLAWLGLARCGIATGRQRGLLLAALASAPVVALQLGGVLTELPFATLLLALAWSFTRWPSMKFIWLSAALGVAALAVRYAGIIAPAIMLGWIATQRRQLLQEGKLASALGAWAAGVAMCAALLATNIAASGELSGASRGTAPGWWSFAAHAADFGWSVPSALFAGGLRDRISTDAPLGSMLGFVATAAMIALCGRAWLRPRSDFSRPLALVAGSYVVGMVALKCIGEFDALHNARTFLPAYAPLLLLAAERRGATRAVIASVALVAVVGGLGSALRGISHQVAGEVRPAVEPLRRALRADDVIAVNDHAFSLSAYLRQRVRRAENDAWEREFAARFFVVAAKPLDRAGERVQWEPQWIATCTRLVRDAQFRTLYRDDKVWVLERASEAVASMPR